MIRSWSPDDEETLFSHPIFSLKRQAVRAGEDRRQAILLDTPDWINVIALLPDDRVITVRQWRYGLAAPTVEIPGGMVDPGEEPLEAAKRELFEETGYRAGSWQQIGDLAPNPAFMNNRIVVYLATDLEWVSEPPGDGEEEIEVGAVPLAEIPDWIARGEIRHSLVVAAFYLLANQAPKAG